MKLIRKDFYEELEAQCGDLAAFRIKHARITMDTLFDLLFDNLVAGEGFRIKKTAKVVPYVKKGGRPVRNPRTGEPSVMPDRYVVSMGTSAGYNQQTGRHRKVKPTSALVEQLEARLASTDVMDKREMAQRAFQVFDEMMGRLKTDENLVIEIRGLAVFRSRFINKDITRNPKTGEVVSKEGPTVRYRFKESKLLLQALANELAKMQ